VFTISKTIEFSAAHHLPHVDDDHPCHRVHGHNYRVIIVAQSRNLDAHGFVLDFGLLSAHIKQYDHHDLNAFFENPTAEEMAKDIYHDLQYEEFTHVRFLSVCVFETESSWAEYSERDDDH
jgi:6-pyruvoyltetrahydropterin/6-carboxytetrahydropterin synthase